MKQVYGPGLFNGLLTDKRQQSGSTGWWCGYPSAGYDVSDLGWACV